MTTMSASIALAYLRCCTADRAGVTARFTLDGYRKKKIKMRV